MKFCAFGNCTCFCAFGNCTCQLYVSPFPSDSAKNIQEIGMYVYSVYKLIPVVILSKVAAVESVNPTQVLECITYFVALSL